jgi:hypothetical protein
MDRGVVHDEAGMLGEPLLRCLRAVGAAVVDGDVDRQCGIDRVLDLGEELDEVSRVVPFAGAAR